MRLLEPWHLPDYIFARYQLTLHPPCQESELVLGRTRTWRARKNLLDHPFFFLCPFFDIPSEFEIPKF